MSYLENLIYLEFLILILVFNFLLFLYNHPARCGCMCTFVSVCLYVNIYTYSHKDVNRQYTVHEHCTYLFQSSMISSVYIVRLADIGVLLGPSEASGSVRVWRPFHPIGDLGPCQNPTLHIISDTNGGFIFVAHDILPFWSFLQ